MDPLSAAASVAGLASLTIEVSRSLTSYCKAVKNARKDVQEVLQELTSMQDVLHQLDNFLRSHQAKTELFDRNCLLAIALNTCGNGIEAISSKLQTLETGGVSRLWEKLKWPFSEKEIQKILATLRRCAATFQFSLTIEGCNLLSHSSQDATKSLQLQLETARRVLELTRDVGTLAESAREASKVSDQVSDILRLISDYSTTVCTVQSLSQGVDALATRSQESRETEILSWLSSHKHSRIHHDIRARRMASTGQWLLEHKEFYNWMNQSNSTLWCSGNPGAGKSVLTSLVIDHIIDKQLSANEAVVYFYFDYRDQEVQTPAYFLASLFRQLAIRKRPLHPSLLDLYNRFKEGEAQDLMSELCEVFQLICESCERVFIVVDALDECKNQGHRKEIVRFLKGLPTAKTRIFVTSRPHPHDIKQYFEEALKIHVEACQTDIRHYCSRMIEESANATDLMGKSLRQQVIDTVSSKAHGMFLLPVLQMQTILEGMTKSEIKASLSNLSANLGQAFENTIRRIDNEPPNRRQVATQALMWVSHALRPLHIDELCHALATRLGDTDLDQDNFLPPRAIIESCSGLIVLDDQSSTVRLVHYTLQDFLRTRRPQLFMQEETNITQVLITYLCFNEVSDSATGHGSVEHGDSEIDQRLLVCSSFLEYAATNWGHHARLSQPSEINELAVTFLKSAPKVTRATQRQTHTQSHSIDQFSHRDPWESRSRRNRTGLHVVAEFGLVELLSVLLDSGLDINARDSYKNTALHDAAIYGQTDALNALLERGARVNMKNFDRNTALYLAVSFCHEQLIQTLLERGANANDHCRDEWSPLHKAADNGHVAIAQTLLNHMACVTVRSARGLIPLHRAAGRGHVQMVRLLLDHHSPVDMTTCDGWTPLHGASSSGRDDVVKVLLDHGAAINKQSGDSRTALHRACRGGHHGVVSILLKRNANPCVRDCGDNLPLHRAAKGGHERITILLLQQDSASPLAQLSALNVLGRKPEKEASCSGHWKVAVLLRQKESLLKGTNVEERGDLELAMEEGNLPRVKELLSNGVDVNKANGDSTTLLHQALFLGNESVAQVLLENGADVSVVTTDGWQPLHCAARNGMANMVRLCLDRQANIAARTLDGQTALHKSCKSGNVETVQVLLDSGANIEAQDNWGWRPLHTAASAGSQDVVELLVATNADLQARDKDSRTVQACAAIAGQHALVEYLRQARHDRY